MIDIISRSNRNKTWRRISKESEHTAPGDSAAKLCGKPLNIDLTNVEKEKYDMTVLFNFCLLGEGVEVSVYFE
jgi:ATP phosphoribosyltransferase regulatory subunit HisZ